MASFYSREQIMFSLTSSVGWISFCVLSALTTLIQLFTENLFTQMLTWLQVLSLAIAVISFLVSLAYGGLAFPRFDSKNRILIRIEAVFNFSSNPKGFIVGSVLLVAVFYGVFMTDGLVNDLFMIVCAIIVALLFLPNTASLIRTVTSKKDKNEDKNNLKQNL
jgi:hypothetical protein